MCLGFKPGATGRYVVIDKTTELWRPPNLHSLWFNICIPTQSHWSHLGFDLLYLWLAAFTVYKCSKKISDDWIRTLEQNRFANLDTTNAQLDTTNAQLDLTMPQKTKYNFVKSNSAFLHKSPRKVLGTCFLSLKDSTEVLCWKSYPLLLIKSYLTFNSEPFSIN